jgi:hypothetical protein
MSGVEQPGGRFSVVATKAVRHKRPAVELHHPGMALKSAQPAPMVPTVANAALAEGIVVGEEFVIALDGAWPVEVALLPAGAAAGDPLWIREADNVLVNAAGAGILKFGRISSIDTTLGLALVNLNLRDTF